jgi:hypothetical protein
LVVLKVDASPRPQVKRFHHVQETAMLDGSLKKWAAALAGRTARRPPPTRRARLGLEALEAREVPATYTWTPTAAGAFNWNDPANWTGGPAGTFPNAVGDVANLTANLVGNQAIRLNTAILVGTLNLGSASTAGKYTVLGGGGSLTFDVAAGSAALTDAGTGGDAVIAPVTLADNITLSGNGTAPLVLGARVVGGAGTITTAGTIRLTSDFATTPAQPLTGPGTVTTAPTMFVTSFYDSALYEVDEANGGVLATLIAPNSPSPLAGPAGLTVGPDDNVYISSQFSDTLLKYDRATQTLGTFTDSTTLNAIAALPANGSNTHFAPAGLRFGPDANLYVSLNGGVTSSVGAVIRFPVTNTAGVLSYTGGVAGAVTVAGGVSQPSGLTFGPAPNPDDLYVSALGASGGTVVRITGATGGSPTAGTFIPGGSSPLEFPAGLAFGTGGKLYVVDLAGFTGQGKVLRYNASGTFDTTFVAPGTGANPGDLAGQFLSDALFDSQGNLVTANLGLNGPTTGHPNDFSGSVYKYTSAGVFSTSLVTSTMFPQTGPTSSYSGIIPSQVGLDLPLQVTALTPTNSGFVVDFNRFLDATDLNLYATGTLGAADMTVTGPVGTAFRWSMVEDRSRTRVTFVATGGVLPAGSYTVTLRSAADGFKDFAGRLLDGDANGTAGTDFSATFIVAASTALVVRLPDFARGAGQAVNIPATATGLPLSISSLAGVTSAQADILFDSTVLSVTGVSTPIAGATATLTPIAGGVRVTVTGIGGATGTALATLTASVPGTAPYTNKEVIQIRNVSVNSGAIAATGDDAVHVAAYLGDAGGSGHLNSGSASLIAQVAVGSGNGFPAYQNADPLLIADVNGSGTLSSADASLVAQKAVGLSVPQIPDLPSGVTLTPGGPDPVLYLTGGAAQPGQSATAQLRMRVTEKAGVVLTSLDAAIRFDPSRFHVSNVRTVGLAAGFAVASNIDNAAGTIRLVAFTAGSGVPLAFGTDGVVIAFDLTVLDTAKPSVSTLNLLKSFGQTVTAAEGPTGPMVLSPAPTDAANDPVDAKFIVLPSAPMPTATSAGVEGGARVLILDGKLPSMPGVTAAYAAPLANFFFGDDSSRGGVRVATVDAEGDAKVDVAVGSGEWQPNRVRVDSGKTIAPGGEPSGSQDLDPFSQVLPGGVFVG